MKKSWQYIIIVLLASILTTGFASEQIDLDALPESFSVYEAKKNLLAEQPTLQISGKTKLIGTKQFQTTASLRDGIYFDFQTPSIHKLDFQWFSLVIDGDWTQDLRLVIQGKHMNITSQAYTIKQKESTALWINFCVYKNQPLRFSLLNNSENKNQFTIKNIQLYPAYDEQYSLPPKVTETRKLQVNIPDLKEKEGTLSFWFQPNWPALAGNFHGRTRKTFLQIPNFLRLEYYLEHPQLKLKDGRKEITIGYDWKQAHQRQWQAYTWHHWAITWKNNRVKNYFDGDLVGEYTLKESLKFSDNKWIQFFTDSANQYGPDSLFSKLAVSTTARSANDIKNEAQERIQKSQHTKHELKVEKDAYSDLREINDSGNTYGEALVPFDQQAQQRIAYLDQQGYPIHDAWAAVLPSDDIFTRIPLWGKIRTGQDHGPAGKQGGRIEVEDRPGSIANTNAFYLNSEYSKLWGYRIAGNEEKKLSIHMRFALKKSSQIVTLFAQGNPNFGIKILLYPTGKMRFIISQQGKHAYVELPFHPQNYDHWQDCWLTINCDEKQARAYLGEQAKSFQIPFESIKFRRGKWQLGESHFPQDREVLIDQVVTWKQVFTPEQIKRFNFHAAMIHWPSKEIPQEQTIEEEVKSIQTADILAYYNFDKNPQATIDNQSSAYELQTTYAAANSETKELNDMSHEETSLPGKFGKGLEILNPTDNGLGHMFKMSGIELPESGTISFWFKPKWNSDEFNSYAIFWYSSWVKAMSRLEQKRIVSYLGLNPKTNKPRANFAATPNIQANTWNLYTFTWQKNKQLHLYINGENILSAPTGRLSEKLKYLYIGSDQLSNEIYGQARANKTKRIHAAIDEVLVLKAPLAAQSVQHLYESKSSILQQVNGYVVNQKRTAFRRDETVHFPITNFQGIPLDIQVECNNQALYRQTHQAQQFTLKFDPYYFAAGTYQVHIKTNKDQHTIDFVIHPDKPAGYLLGAYALWKKPGDKAFHETLKDSGFQFTITGPIIDWKFPAQLNALYEENLYAVPNIGVDWAWRKLKKDGIPQKDYAQIDRSGTMHALSTTAPIAREAEKEQLLQTFDTAKHSPIYKYQSLWDERLLRDDISPSVKEDFLKHTPATQIPDFNPIKKGTILKKDASIVHWIDYFGVDFWISPQLAREASPLTSAAKTQNPHAKTMAMPSSGFGGFDIEVVEVYPYLIESPNASLWGKTELMAETGLESYFATLKEREQYPLCILPGWLNFPGTPYARQSLNVMLQIAFAKGAQGAIPAPTSWYWTRPDMKQDFDQFSAFVRKLGPSVKTFPRPFDKRVAVFWNELHYMSTKHGWKRMSSVPGKAIIPTLRLAGFDAAMIRKDILMSKQLHEFPCLILPQFDLTSEDVLKQIESYIEQGGRVYVFADTAIKPKDAIVLPKILRSAYPLKRIIPGERPTNQVPGYVQQWRHILADEQMSPELEVSNPYIASYSIKNSQLTYHFLINTDLFQDYSITVTRNQEKPQLYLLQPQSYSKHQSIFHTKLAAGAWQVYAETPHKVNQAKIDVKLKEKKLLASIQLLDQHQQNLSSGWPIQVELLDPKGIVVEKYSTALVDENARYDYVLPAHAQRGSWSLKVTELIQQKTFVSKVELK